MNGPGWQRRARPLLGTLVEVGLRGNAVAIDAAFAAIAEAEACLSRFDAASDIGRFAALPVGGSIVLRPATRTVLAAAASLRDASDGAFDVSLGTAPRGWRCDGTRLTRLAAATRLDLGGIGKGFAVDAAVEAMRAHGAAAGWVNAGGDLRAFGDVDLPVWLRDEVSGGARPFATLADGAFATSCLGPARASRLAGAPARDAHASVAAPECLWADALTKLVATTGRADHPLLARHGATAWIH